MVWVATSDDLPGLATEAVTMEGLIEKLKVIIPELLIATNNTAFDGEVPFEVITRQFEATRQNELEVYDTFLLFMLP